MRKSGNIMLILLILASLTTGDILFNSFSLQSNSISKDTTDAVTDFLTIEDLNWTFGYIPRDPYLPLNLISPDGFDYEINETVIHVFETGDEYDIFAGCYAEIPVLNGIVDVFYEARAKAGHVDAANLVCVIYDNVTREQLYYWEPYSTPQPTTDTGFNSFNRTYLLDDLDSVLIFFAYSDGHLANWNKEFWIRNLEIYNDIPKDTIVQGNVLDAFRSASGAPRGLISEDNTFLNVAGGNRARQKFYEYDSSNGNVLSSADATGDPIGLATNGTHFWQTYVGGTVIYVYDSSFTHVETISIGTQTYGGMTFDGTHLWVSNNKVNTIYKIDKDTGVILDYITTPGSTTRGLEYDGENIWLVDDGLMQIFKIELENGSVIDSFDYPFATTWGITISDDYYIWLTCQASYFIYKLDLQAIEDYDPPIIIAVEQVYTNEGITGKYINWTLQDENPDYYSIYRDGIIIQQDTWENNETILIHIDSITVNIYNYTLVAYDTFNNKAIHTIIVYVQASRKTSAFLIFIIIPLAILGSMKKRKKNQPPLG